MLTSGSSGSVSWADTSSVAQTQIVTNDTSVSTTDSGDGYVSFTEDGTEHLRLTGGNFGIGTTSPNTRLQVNGTITTLGLIVGTSASSRYFMPNNRGSSGEVLTAGGGTNVNWSTISVGSSEINDMGQALILLAQISNFV